MSRPADKFDIFILIVILVGLALNLYNHDRNTEERLEWIEQMIEETTP